MFTAFVRFAFARDGGVEGQADEFYRGEFVDAGEHVGGFAAVGLDVELPAEDLGGRGVGDDLFGRLRGVVGDDLHGTVGCAGEGDAVFAGGVREACHGGGGDVDWGGERVGEEGGAEVGVGAVDEDAGAEEDGGVDCGVEVFGAEVVGGGVVVGPALFAEFLAGCFFYFVEVEEV